MMMEIFEEPFMHWLLCDLGKPLPDNLTIPSIYDWCWTRYENDCECHKRTFDAKENMSDGWRVLFSDLARRVAVSLQTITGIRPLIADLYGAGIQVIDPGGWLQPHLDYNIHPDQPHMERRVNLVLFLNHGWKPEWGGAFELYDDAGRNLVKRIYPEYGQAVVWLGGDTTFHGTQQTTPDAPPRVTAACYYLSPARPNATIRKRALFVPRRQK
jgi:2OG-Fe(II) oxygenase superfamily